MVQEGSFPHAAVASLYSVASFKPHRAQALIAFDHLTKDACTQHDYNKMALRGPHDVWFRRRTLYNVNPIPA